MPTMMILSPSGLLLGLGSLAALALTRRKRAKSTSTSSKTLPPPPPSPFVRGSSCTALSDEAEVDRWLQDVVAPVVLPRLDAYDIPLHEHAAARLAISQIVDDVLAKTASECAGYRTTATRQVWKWLWCDVVTQLILRGRLDEEVDDVLALCADPSFDPQAPRPPDDAPSPEPTPPKAPGTHPLPPFPMPMDGSATGPMDGTMAGPPANVWTASSRQELSALGVTRLLEGTVGGMPIFGPAARVVLLAFNPAWSGLETARADLQQLAAENPALSFVEVSFADTQRHFGKPKDVYGIAWALTSAAPDGRVYPALIVRHDARDAAPTADHWNKVIAHASGYLGFGRVASMVRPRRFGDVVRAMARARTRAVRVVSRPRPTRGPTTPQTRRRPGARPNKPSSHPPRRRGG